MCLIIASKANKAPLSHLRNAYHSGNEDGWGICYWDRTIREVLVAKGFELEGPAGLIATYRNLPAGAPHLVHLRWATHGTTTLANCHPFRISDSLWLTHNGILTVRKDLLRGPESDTAAFARELREIIGQPTLLRWLKNDDPDEGRIARLIGTGNKLAFLHNSQIFLVNPKMGHWSASGIWYSNTHYHLRNSIQWRRYDLTRDLNSDSRYVFDDEPRQLHQWELEMMEMENENNPDLDPYTPAHERELYVPKTFRPRH